MIPQEVAVHVAIDLDGTIDAAPAAFTFLMKALRGDGVLVTILTGNSTASAGYLGKLGVPSTAYDQIVVVPDTTLPTEKAAWCASNDVKVFIDNKADNCMTAVAAGVPLAFLPITPQMVQSAQARALRRSRRLLDD